jgi:hypothetical protein
MLLILYKTRFNVWFRKIIKSFFFNNFLIFALEGYLEMLFGSTLNMASASFESTATIISFAIATLFTSSLIIFMCVSFAILYDKRKEITGHQYTNAEIDEEDKTVYHHRMSALFENLKMTKWYIIQFYPIFMLRRTLLVFLLIFGGRIDWLQMNLFILLVALVSLFS